MFSESTLYLMLVVAALITIGLCWPLGKELHHAYVKRRLRRRIHADHLYWLAVRRQHAREVFR